MHLGHRAVLRRTVETARERGLPSVAVTFDRHPREVLTPGKEPRLLTTVERKADLIEETGIDVLLVLEFTEDFSRWPAEDFISRVLVDGLRADHCVMGANFTFGHKAAGTVETLIERGPAYGFTAERVELLEIDGRRVSSSSIRDALAEGDLEWPRTALGRRFVILILGYQVLSALASQLADFLVFDRAAARFPEAAELAGFLAGYTVVMNLVSIGFLFVVAGPLLRRFGLRAGIAANPVVLTVFAVAMLVIDGSLGGASLALLAVVSAARIADVALTDGTTRTSIKGRQ